MIFPLNFCHRNSISVSLTVFILGTVSFRHWKRSSTMAMFKPKLNKESNGPHNEYIVWMSRLRSFFYRFYGFSFSYSIQPCRSVDFLHSIFCHPHTHTNKHTINEKTIENENFIIYQQWPFIFTAFLAICCALYITTNSSCMVAHKLPLGLYSSVLLWQFVLSK